MGPSPGPHADPAHSAGAAASTALVPAPRFVDAQLLRGLAGRGQTGVCFVAADATSLPFANGELNFVYTNKTTQVNWRSRYAEVVMTR